MSKRTEKDDMYLTIYKNYSKDNMTLEEIGIKHGVTKARVWQIVRFSQLGEGDHYTGCLLYTSPSPRDGLLSRMPSSA